MLEKKRLYWQFIGSSCLLLFIFLGYCVKFYPESVWLTSIDHYGAQFIQQSRPQFNELFNLFTFLGNPTTVVAITTAVIIYLLMKKQRIEATYLAINTVIFAGLLNFLAKNIFLRVRPMPHYYIEASGYSFPSGHADGSLLLYGTLFLIFYRQLKKHHLQWPLLIITIMIILGVGVSRIYFNVHYPSDIIGGYLLGGGIIGLTYPIFCQKRFIYEFKGGKRS